jgi:hypothetical protein
MKKRLTKNEKEIIKKINQMQKRSIERMRLKSIQLTEISQSIIKKIDDLGINGYYSCNSDCFRVSQDIWKESLRLSELKSLQDDIIQSFNLERSKSKK